MAPKDQPRNKGKFVSRSSNLPRAGINEDPNAAATVPSSVPRINHPGPVSHKSSSKGVKDIEASPASSVLLEASSRTGDLVESIQPPSSRTLVGQSNSDEPSSMSLADVTAKWMSRLRPRGKDGKVVASSRRRATEAIPSLVEQFANISLESDLDSGSRPSDTDSSYGKDLEDEVDEALEMANDVLQSDELRQLRPLEEAREAIKDLSKARVVVAKYKKANPTLKHVDVVSFSKLTWKHLENMGISKGTLLVENFNQKIEDTFNFNAAVDDKTFSEIFGPFWDSLTKTPDYIDLFEDIVDTVAEPPEARARLLTDHVLLRVMIFLKKYLSRVPLLFLELTLSALTDPDPVVIVHDDRATFITGSVDYAIISSTSTADELQSTGTKHQVEKLIKESTLKDLLKQDQQLAKLLRDMNRFKLAIIEEKRKDYTGPKLEDVEPQVIGECLGIARKTGRYIVPWCISNGEEWLFGLLCDEEQIQSYRLPIVTIRKESRKQDLEQVFKLLIMWTAISDEVILESFFTPSKRTTRNS